MEGRPSAHSAMRASSAYGVERRNPAFTHRVVRTTIQANNQAKGIGPKAMASTAHRLKA